MADVELGADEVLVVADDLPFPWGDPPDGDRHAAWRALREDGPVAVVPGPVTGNDIHWVVGYDACVRVLADAATFRNDFRPFMASDELSDEMAALNRNLLNLDPPDHTRLRRLVSKAFTPRVVGALEPRIRALVGELLDRAQASGGFDAIADLGLPVPLTVIAELLGVPEEDRDRFHRWSRVVVANDRLDDLEDQDAVAREVVPWLVALIERRRVEPGDDLLSSLVEVEDEGDRLDLAELLSMVFLLLVAGHETTVNLIGNGLLSLVRFPEQQERLLADPGLVRSTVEEVLRFEGPVESTIPRWAAEDVEIGGVTIPRGGIVGAVPLAANRDPAAFPDPDRFDVGRTPTRHLAFGHGIHFCVGAALARLEGRVVFDELRARGWRLRPGQGLDPESPPWVASPHVLMHGLERLPLEIVAR